MEKEQQGCIQKSLGCKQLTVIALVLKQAHEKKCNIHMHYIGYHKAFDLVPHSWLMKVLQMYRICPHKEILQLMISTRRTVVWVNNKNDGIVSTTAGIFQEDLFSTEWFFQALNPILLLLNTSEIVYKLNIQNERRLSSLLYVDDLHLSRKLRKVTLFDTNCKKFQHRQ